MLQRLSPDLLKFSRPPIVICCLLCLLTSLWGCLPMREVKSTAPSRSSVFPEEVAATLFGHHHDAKDSEETVSDTAVEPGNEDISDADVSGEAELDELTAPEPENTVDQELKELEKTGSWEEGQSDLASTETKVEYDFPITMNRQVQFYIDFFCSSHRAIFSKWLARSGRYLPMMQKELEAAGMPLDLAYLPMIESGYNLAAFSSAEAVGPWQFIRSTGQFYGLTVNDFIDERRDPIKSTKAAVTFLSELYEEFGSWPVAVAGYNAGPGKIRGAIKLYNTSNFWELAQNLYLKPETRLYVPKLIAAIIISKSPEKYGFTDIKYEAPLAYETIQAPGLTSLRAVAVAGSIDLEELHNLNRELRQMLTPPDDLYTIKVPVGRKEIVSSNLPRVHAVVSIDYKSHVVQKGESLTRICNTYKLNKTTLLKANNLRAKSIKVGQSLRIPFKTTTYTLMAKDFVAPSSTQLAKENMILHILKPGETISQLATQYSVPTHQIASWNNLKDINQVKNGQEIALYLEDADKSGTKVKTASKESAAPTAAKVTGNASVRTVQTASAKDTYYQVRGGDSLWTIAQKFKLSTEDIKEWNNLKNDFLYPGKRLLLKLSADGA